MNQPIITFRNSETPFEVLTSLDFLKSTEVDEITLPVLRGEKSDSKFFRIYNNFDLEANIATALNVRITTYDGAGSGSHTASLLPTSQQWLHVFLNGFGEGSVEPGALNWYKGLDTPVGGGNNMYLPERGSNNGTISQIRATAASSLGFMEFESYITVPLSASANQYDFVITAEYEWVS